MSSHREAPAISKDPVADNTDTYAFVQLRATRSRSSPTTCRSQAPAGGPNFYEFGDDVLYAIYIDNDGDGRPERQLPVPVQDHHHEPEHVPLQHRPDHRARQPQLEPAADLHGHQGDVRPRGRAPGHGASAPTCRARRATSARGRRRTTPSLAAGGGRRRCPPARRCSPASAPRRFFVDLGSIFDLGTLRPFQTLHLIPDARPPPASTRSQQVNVHTIAIQVPIRRPDARRLDAHRRAGADVGDRRLGRGEPAEGARVRDGTGAASSVGSVGAGVAARQPAVQRGHRADGPQGRVERVGPDQDVEFAQYVAPTRAGDAAAGAVPRRVPEPRRAQRRPRRPAGDPAHRASPPASSPGSRTSPGRRRPTCCGSTSPSRRRRRRTGSASLGGDAAGFPNGRRLGDDVVTIELRAVAGATYPAGRPDATRPTARPARSRTARSPTRAGRSSTSSPTSACRTAATTSPPRRGGVVATHTHDHTHPNDLYTHLAH